MARSDASRETRTERSPELQRVVRAWSAPDDDPVSRQERMISCIGRGVSVDDCPAVRTRRNRRDYAELEAEVHAIYAKGRALDVTGNEI